MIEIYCLTILEAINPKSTVSAEPWYFWNLWRKSFLVSGGLPTIFGSWVVAFFFLSWNCIAWISDDILPVYLSVFIRPLFFKVPCTLCSVLSRVFLFGTTWTIAGQALSMGFFRQEYWSGLPFPHPGYFPKPAIEPASPVSPALQMDSLRTEPQGKLRFVRTPVIFN